MTATRNNLFDVLVMGDFFSLELRVDALAAFADNELGTTFVEDLADGSDDYPNALSRAIAQLTDVGFVVDTADNTLRVSSPISPEAPHTAVELAERIDQEKAVKAVCTIAAIIGAAENLTYEHTESVMEAIGPVLAGTSAPSISTGVGVHRQYWEAIID